MATLITYNEDVSNEIHRLLEQEKNKVEECSQKMTSNFASQTSHGILVNTVNDTNKEFVSSQELLEKTANAFVKHSGEMFDYDRKIALDIENMVIPQDFVANNSIEINTYNTVVLSKLDGKAVTEGHAAEKAEYDDETIVAAEKLADINKNKDVSKKDYNDTTIVGRSVLADISNGQVEGKTYNDSTSVGNTKLKNMTGEDAQKQEINNVTNVNNQSLADINNGEVVNQNFDESTIVGKSVLADIGNNANKIGFDSVIAASQELMALEQSMRDSKDKIDKRLLSNNDDSKKEM